MTKPILDPIALLEFIATEEDLDVTEEVVAETLRALGMELP
jgi:hypothetical protein